MSKQTAKQFVLEMYPSAKLVGLDYVGYSVKNFAKMESNILGEGISADQAWQNAKAKIEEMEKKNEN